VWHLLPDGLIGEVTGQHDHCGSAVGCCVVVTRTTINLNVSHVSWQITLVTSATATDPAALRQRSATAAWEPATPSPRLPKAASKPGGKSVGGCAGDTQRSVHNARFHISTENARKRLHFVRPLAEAKVKNSRGRVPPGDMT
jgi:hypothetical protein